MEEIIEFEGIFGIERETWDNRQSRVNEKSHTSELAFQVGDCYLSVQEVDDGYDYSMFNAAYKLLDGGVYDNPNLPITEVADELIQELKEQSEGDVISINYEKLMEQAEEANKIVPMIEEKLLNQIPCSEIEETVLAYAQAKAEEYGYEVRILEAKVYGSRMAGVAKPDSDLDVVVEYQGEIREDDFFTMLHEDGLSMGGMMLDINPITAERSGTIEAFLERSNQMLQRKIAEEKKPLSIAEKLEQGKQQLAKEFHLNEEVGQGTKKDKNYHSAVI